MRRPCGALTPRRPCSRRFADTAAALLPPRGRSPRKCPVGGKKHRIAADCKRIFWSGHLERREAPRAIFPASSPGPPPRGSSPGSSLRLPLHQSHRALHRRSLPAQGSPVSDGACNQPDRGVWGFKASGHCREGEFGPLRLHALQDGADEPVERVRRQWDSRGRRRMQGRAPARPAFREISGDFFWWRRLLPQMPFGNCLLRSPHCRRFDAAT